MHAFAFPLLIWLGSVLLASPVKAETLPQNAMCEYFRLVQHPVASVQAPCYFKKFPKRNDLSKIDIYVQLIDGTSLFYDGSKVGVEYSLSETDDGIYLKRDGVSTLDISEW